MKPEGEEIVTRRWTSLELLLLALFGLLLLNLADSTARYLSTYYLGTAYPLGTVVKPLVLAGAVILAVLFAIQARREISGKLLTRRSLGAVAFLATATGILFLDTKALLFLGLSIPYVLTDASWFILYALALVAFPLFLAVRVRRSYGWALAAVFLLLAAGFSTKLLDHLYFWVQSVGGFALPYGVVLVGMFGPSLTIAAAGFVVLAREVRRGSIAIPSGAFWGLLAIPAVFLVPPAIQAFGTSLPNLILRGWTFWSLGYVGYSWYTPSLFAAAFATYVFLLVRLRSRNPVRRLLFFALLTFPLSGIFVLFLDYSSIPGNLLSMMGAAVALDLLAARREAA
ncbi:MAG: hypothetical protein ACE5HJ_07760 [Thermoplasmata archaeon]